MKTFTITKKSGSVRTIYSPSGEEKEVLYRHLPSIARKAKQVAGNHVHGFVRGRSPVTAARQHVGHAWTASFDLADFFDSVSEAMLAKVLTKEQREAVLIDGAPRQGLPTSPSVANLAAIPLDKALLKAFERKEKQVVYTRYADDLTFSGDCPETLEWLLTTVPQIVGRCGFRINKDKTHVQHASAGRRIILGISVGESDIRPTRETKRRLRAAEHQGRKDHAAGLREWSKLRMPRERSPGADGLDALAKRYRLGKLPAEWPVKATESLGEHAEITGDPVAMLGMSLWTTGWTSCHDLRHGCHKRGCLFWAGLKGTRVACIYHESKCESHAGIERRLMRARCLVHTLVDGTTWYDRMYGEDAAKKELIELLKGKGIRSVKGAPKGVRVVGDAPTKRRAWFDTLRSRIDGSKRIVFV